MLSSWTGLAVCHMVNSVPLIITSLWNKIDGTVGWNKQPFVLTHSHTMTHFDALKIYSCGIHCKKKRNCL